MKLEIPWSEESEDALLATVLFYGDSAREALVKVTWRDFYGSANAAVFRAIGRVSAAGEVPDLCNVAVSLQEHGGGEFVPRLAELSGMIPNLSSLMKLCATISARAQSREIISASERAIADCVALVDPDIVLADMSGRMMSVRRGVDSGAHGMDTIIPEVLEDISSRVENGPRAGVSTGFGSLDELTCGLGNSDLVLLAGRPSMGKTALALNIVQNVAKSGVVCLVFSLEMSAAQLGERLICSATSVGSGRIRRGLVSSADLSSIRRAGDCISPLPVYIDDTAGVTIDQLTARAKVFAMSHEVGLVVVDYIQLMSGVGNNREREVSAISVGLKTLARALNVPVLALSQLNRSLESRPDKRPVMSDLRDSGSLEQDADLIMFIYRDEVYNTSTDNPCRGLAEIIIRKQRRGPIGTVGMTFDGPATQFGDQHS